MKIIIVGIGKTGATLVHSLADEGHDVTVIDKNPEKIAEITNDYDILGIEGDGLDMSTLEEAGLNEADVLISVSGSDEQNLLCCMFAKKNQNCSTIARVRNPVLLNESTFLREQIGISMIINPESAAANEISKLLRFPSVVDINTFAKGKAEMLTFKLPESCKICGNDLNYIRNKIENEVLFCCVERGGEYIIPNGDFVLLPSDKATVVLPQNKSIAFFKKIGIESHHVKDVIIAGGGTMAYYLAQALIANGIKVKIIEESQENCNELSQILPEALVIHGDATNKNLLIEEGIETTGAFVALTGIDEENVILSLFASQTTNAKAIGKVDRIDFGELLENLSVDTLIYPCEITAECILQYVRSKQNAMGNNVENLYKLVEDKVEALEFKINDNAPIIGIPLKDMSLKDNLIICCIIRKGKFILPKGDTTVQPGDSVIVVTGQKMLSDVGDILK